MTETQREAVPLNDDGELDTALAFLAFNRHCVFKKIEGLSEEQLRRVLVPSGTSLLGLVQHMTVGERWWFVHHFTEGGEDGDWDFGMTVPESTSAAEVLDGYVAAIAESDAMIARLADPAALTTRPVHDRPQSLRWVLTHMINETARHLGHADILREQIDGVTGR